MAKRVRNPEETRNRLIEAAVRLMLRQGYASTTVDQICEESGLTKGRFSIISRARRRSRGQQSSGGKHGD
jgi:hypothetical protein